MNTSGDSPAPARRRRSGGTQARRWSPFRRQQTVHDGVGAGGGEAPRRSVRRVGPRVAAQVAAELAELRQRIPGAEVAVAATLDGEPIAEDGAAAAPGGDGPGADGAALLAAAMLAHAGRMTAELARGDVRNTVTWGTEGYVAVYAAGADALLVILAGPEANVGRLHLEARAGGQQIGVLLAHAEPVLGRRSAKSDRAAKL